MYDLFHCLGFEVLLFTICCRCFGFEAVLQFEDVGFVCRCFSLEVFSQCKGARFVAVALISKWWPNSKTHDSSLISFSKWRSTAPLWNHSNRFLALEHHFENEKSQYSAAISKPKQWHQIVHLSIRAQVRNQSNGNKQHWGTLETNAIVHLCIGRHHFESRAKATYRILMLRCLWM